jgi:hypothetical protein
MRPRTFVAMTTLSLGMLEFIHPAPNNGFGYTSWVPLGPSGVYVSRVQEVDAGIQRSTENFKGLLFTGGPTELHRSKAQLRYFYSGSA